MLGPGDLIFHPRNGFGAIRGLTRRDPFRPGQDGVAGETVPDQAQDYYDIQLVQGGTLFVPVKRARRLGLRLLTNGVDVITACLHSPPRSLPNNARERAAELLARSKMDEPTALAASVRDMVAQSRGRSFTASEKTWLDKACERLSVEAALVDHISKTQAHDVIWKMVKQLSAP